MESSAEQVCHLHLLIDSVTKKCDGQTDRQAYKQYPTSVYSCAQTDVCPHERVLVGCAVFLKPTHHPY